MELNIPFAETGNREDFPINATSDQSLSLEKGYPIPYQLKPEEGGKFILRPQFNQAMYLVSKEVVDWRTQTFPNWSAELSAGLKYKKNSIVKYSDGNVYVSNIDNNTSLPTSADWTNFNNFGSIDINALSEKTTPIDTDNLVIQQTDGLLKKLSFANLKAWILSLFQPILTGTATLVSATNQVTMTNIVSALGLEVGDVIQFTVGTDANNAKMRTVESITDNNTIILNYEHCGNRGNGPLKLSDQSNITCTVKRIAKYYNASTGLGQDWVTLTSFRTLSSNNTNSTKREIKVSVSVGLNGGIEYIVDGARYSYTTTISGNTNTQPALIDSNSIYSVISNVAMTLWRERR